MATTAPARAGTAAATPPPARSGPARSTATRASPRTAPTGPSPLRQMPPVLFAGQHPVELGQLVRRQRRERDRLLELSRGAPALRTIPRLPPEVAVGSSACHPRCARDPAGPGAGCRSFWRGQLEAPAGSGASSRRCPQVPAQPSRRCPQVLAQPSGGARKFRRSLLEVPASSGGASRRCPRVPAEPPRGARKFRRSLAEVPASSGATSSRCPQVLAGLAASPAAITARVALGINRPGARRQQGAPEPGQALPRRPHQLRSPPGTVRGAPGRAPAASPRASAPCQGSCSR